MTHLRQFERLLPFLWLLAVPISRTSAQEPPGVTSPAQVPQDVGADSAPKDTVGVEEARPNYVETGVSYRQLTNGFGDWSGGYARAVFGTAANVWSAEVNGQHEFGDGGVYLAAGDTHNFNSDWYASLTLGTSVQGFFWPRFRADAFLNRKWRERKQFVTSIGYGAYDSKDVHHDESVFLGSAYYFQSPWIVEDGVRLNVSRPGTVVSASGFVAVTQGVNTHHYVTVNVGFGQEAYQIVGPTMVLTRFPSQTFTTTWRQWIAKGWGFDLVADYYHSPYYQRGGGSFGIFKEF